MFKKSYITIMKSFLKAQRELEVMIKDENNNTRKYIEDIHGNLVKIIESNKDRNFITQYRHDASGRITYVRDSNNDGIDFVYDTLGRKVSEHDNNIG